MISKNLTWCLKEGTTQNVSHLQAQMLLGYFLLAATWSHAIFRYGEVGLLQHSLGRHGPTIMNVKKRPFQRQATHLPGAWKCRKKSWEKKAMKNGIEWFSIHEYVTLGRLTAFEHKKSPNWNPENHLNQTFMQKLWTSVSRLEKKQ